MFTTQLLLSISRILNVLLVLGIVLFSFAVAGVEFFGDVRYGAFLNGNRNFDDIPNTLMMLVRVTFSEWVYARHDCRVQSPECTDGYDCGSVMATPYFALLLLLNAYILANMFVAVVLTDFTWLVSHCPLCLLHCHCAQSLSLSAHCALPLCFHSQPCFSVQLLNHYAQALFSVVLIWQYASEVGITLGDVSGMLSDGHMKQVELTRDR